MNVWHQISNIYFLKKVIEISEVVWTPSRNSVLTYTGCLPPKVVRLFFEWVQSLGIPCVHSKLLGSLLLSCSFDPSLSNVKLRFLTFVTLESKWSKINNDLSTKAYIQKRYESCRIKLKCVPRQDSKIQILCMYCNNVY